MKYIVRVYHREDTPSNEHYLGPYSSATARDSVIAKVQSAIDGNGDSDFEVSWEFLYAAYDVEEVLSEAGIR